MKFFFIIILFFSYALTATEINCNFEEVYENGEIQQGFFLLKNEKLRYEYIDKNLYTLLYANRKLFLIDNQNRKQIQLIENHNKILPTILEIQHDYPNFKNKYKKNDYEIVVEKGNNEFIKRLAIKSDQIKVSIFLMNCNQQSLNPNYFNFNPFFEYVSD